MVRRGSLAKTLGECVLSKEIAQEWVGSSRNQKKAGENGA